MTFNALPAGARVFLDANCLIYAATADPTYGMPCQWLLDEIENKRLEGCTSAHVLGDLCHRLMTIEAMQAYGWKAAGIAGKLRSHPSEVKTLKQFRQAIQEIPLFGVRILAIDPTWLDAAAAVSQQTGLLHNDALVVAAMLAHGLTALASADPDFDRVLGITRYRPA